MGRIEEGTIGAENAGAIPELQSYGEIFEIILSVFQFK